MSAMLPAKRPEMTRDQVTALARSAGVTVDQLRGVVVLGRRGYYRDTMGVVGANDIGVYDDAIFVVTPTRFAAFNGNTDPTRHAPNRATLMPGVYTFERVIHNRSKDPALHPHYPAFGQRGNVTVYRDGTEGEAIGAKDWRGVHVGCGQWRGDFAIHLHAGDRTTTSSEGCQTIPREGEQWSEAYALIDAEMTRLGVSTFTYVLTDRGDAAQ